MGIPTYFAHLIRDYPLIIKKQLGEKIGRIFLDLNCAIHPCCREIIEKYKNIDISDEKLEEEMIKNVIGYIEKIVKFTDPQTLLYIAIDGVAPRAKCSQQQLRRFKSIKEKKYINKIKLECGKQIYNTWDTNAITPGTVFMSKLSLDIKKFINKSKSINCNIIFSDSSVAGEGEHKILQYMKKNNSTENLYDIIYGLDADLIMLALTTNISNIALLREPVHFQKNRDDIENEEEFLYLDINYLKLQLSNELNCKLDNSNNSNITEKLITDYIFLCMLLGNDFLPHLPSMTIKTGGIDKLLDYYCEVRNKENTNLIISSDAKNSHSINLIFLKKILYKISENEDMELYNLYQKRKKFRIPHEHCNDYYEEQMHEMNYYPIINREIEDIVMLGEKDWKSRYYKKCFDNIQGREYEIHKICKNYYEGLNWNLQYYFNDCASWVWYYKHRHAPSVSDLIKYINSEKFTEEIHFNNSVPYSPFSVLMMVLPPESHFLLPDNYKKLHKNIESGIVEYYPIDFKLDTLNKKYYWECYPILPDINIDKLSLVLSKCKLTMFENERNTPGNEIVVTKKKNFTKIIEQTI